MNLITPPSILSESWPRIQLLRSRSPSAAIQPLDHSWRDTCAVPSNARHSEFAVKSFPPDKADVQNIGRCALLSMLARMPSHPYRGRLGRRAVQRDRSVLGGDDKNISVYNHLFNVSGGGSARRILKIDLLDGKAWAGGGYGHLVVGNSTDTNAGCFAALVEDDDWNRIVSINLLGRGNRRKIHPRIGM